MVSRGFFKPFFRDVPNLDFFEVDLNGRHKGIFGLFRLYQDLKKLGVTVFADLHHVLRSRVVRVFFQMSGFPVASIDKGRDEKKALTRPENKVFKPLRLTVERYADVFRKLGFPVDLSHPVFPDASVLDEKTKGFAGEKSGKWIGIAPFAKHQGKVYPMDLMEKVVSGLAADPENKLFLFGAGASEKADLEKLSVKENIVSCAGKLSLSQEMDLISNLDVMLSMDSGNAHIASLLGVPTMTLWGATHPFAGFAPFHQPEENLLTSDRKIYPLLPTSIYGNKIVPGYEDAMRTIAPETIIHQINKILNS